MSQDMVAEPGESFAVNLTSPSGAAISKPQGTGVILDDDSGPPPSGGPLLREAVTGGSTSSNSVTTASPLGGQGGDLYLAAVSFKSNVAVASVQGLGLAWTPVRAQCGARAQTGVALFRAQAGAATGGNVTASFSSTPSAAVIAVARYAGANAAAPIGGVRSANTNGISGGCSGGTDGAAYAFDLATGAANSLVFVAVGMRNRDHVPGSGYAETAEGFAGSSGSVAGASLAQRLQGAAGTAGVNGSFNGTVDWAVVAAEVLAAGTAPPPQTVQLSLSTTAGGSVSLSPPGGSYPAGTSVGLTATPGAGYVFSGWSGALAGSANPATLLMDASKSVTASFAPQLFSLVVTTSGTGSVSLSPPGGAYAPGTLVALTAVPGTGASFLGWGGSLSGAQNPATLVMDASKTVSASFTTTITYTLTVGSASHGSVVLSPPGGVYAPGTVVTLTAVPASGWLFKSWSGALSGSTNPATLVMNSNRSVTPSFRKRR